MNPLEFKRAEALPAPETVIAAYLGTAGTAQTYDVPPGASYVVFTASGGDFYACYIDGNDPTDLVTNGALATDTDWTKGTGWTIAAGVASCDGTQVADSDLVQSPTGKVEGRAYRTTFTVSNYLAGNIRPVTGGTLGTNVSANGTVTETVIAGSGSTVGLRADLDFNGDVDDISVVPIAILPTADNITGYSNEMNPTKRYIGQMRKISLVASANATVVTMAFYKES